MIDLSVVFWSFMLFTSIFWYGFLVFYVGAKGGAEIKEMTRALRRRAAATDAADNPDHPDA